MRPFARFYCTFTRVGGVTSLAAYRHSIINHTRYMANVNLNTKLHVAAASYGVKKHTNDASH